MKKFREMLDVAEALGAEVTIQNGVVALHISAESSLWWKDGQWSGEQASIAFPPRFGWHDSPLDALAVQRHWLKGQSEQYRQQANCFDEAIKALASADGENR